MRFDQFSVALLEFRGLSILGADAGRARELAEADPAVRARRFSVLALPRMVPGGAMSFSPAHFPPRWLKPPRTDRPPVAPEGGQQHADDQASGHGGQASGQRAGGTAGARGSTIPGHRRTAQTVYPSGRYQRKGRTRWSMAG
ncbi:MAG TPA: hypothetical protein VG268_13980 [Streptosporangiaceae bacterium]|nr:hypothetical protein [Streptosporangiaceae bacterium]